MHTSISQWGSFSLAIPTSDVLESNIHTYVEAEKFLVLPYPEW